MFSNGKFKNVVALVKGSDVVMPSQTHTDTYILTPHRGKSNYDTLTITIKPSLIVFQYIGD